ncbi:class I SAM-dependent methyltransferase [Fictibacillus nanhaiensis]|uniref:class I SAM-dependent methyltransferase n=1 Tax=Fictibacillus nanhaiensis TaxID=742169 RepID=UPI001C97AB26|nr:class I SAM-dependent methyltransferase [Fictibacillus nanhaiensis]MBY6037804.1 class I SAM-dependent methyltransferase [Fictibacillus nanhaiensis]
MRTLKQSFNDVADSYEKYRPTYPSQLFTDILHYSLIDPQDDILEIGCGTGKATEGFLHDGYSKITCVEYGENLANLTKEKFLTYPQVSVIHSPFEDWVPGDTQFSLAFSGTAFHFISPHIGYPKVASCLKEDGVLALFWFVHVASNEPVYVSINEVYKEHAPHLDDFSIPAIEAFIEERSNLTLESGQFHKLKVHTYKWNQLYTPEDYIGLLNTHSGHQVLQHDQKDALYCGIERAILKHGDTVSKEHAVVLFLARKRS